MQQMKKTIRLRGEIQCALPVQIFIDASHFFVISATPRFHNAKCLVPRFPLSTAALWTFFLKKKTPFIRVLLKGKRGLREAESNMESDILLVLRTMPKKAPKTMAHEDGVKLHTQYAWAFKTGNQSPRVQIWGLVVDCSISLCIRYVQTGST